MSERKLIQLETNYAQKLEHNEFFHIAFIPKNGLKNYKWCNLPVTISTVDDSYPSFNGTLKDVLVYRLDELPEHLTLRSHNLTKDEFETYLNLLNNNAVDQYTLLGAYLYKKD